MGSAVIAGLLSMFGAGQGLAAVNTVPVTVNIPALGGPVDIGRITVDDQVESGGEDFIRATFELKPEFAFLKDWYDFRWLNIVTSINGNTDGVNWPVVGDLPAIDPAPGDGIANGQPGDDPTPPPAEVGQFPDMAFNDGKPWYFTDAEQAGFMPTRPFSDARRSFLFPGRVIAFTTYLCVESKTDTRTPKTDVCILSGFSWTSTIPAGGGEGDESFGAAIPAPGAADQAAVQGALDNSPTVEGSSFTGFTARTDCPLRACFVTTGADLDGDGDVDSDDLGILLGDFGCVGADCVGDVDGLGDTNSDDLGVLLGEFGSVYGGCCLPSGECLEPLRKQECVLIGGFWLGQGAGCPLCPLLVPGACCFPNGFCVDFATALPCEAQGGFFAGPFTTCADCQALSCPGDLNGDGFVNEIDLDILQANIGCTGPGCVGDLNGDGEVNLIDAQILLGLFGPCDPTQCLGDFNGDGVVSALDADILLQNLGCTGPQCVGDLNNDGVVNQIDFQILQTLFGPCQPSQCPGDLNGDGVVNALDLAILIAHGGCSGSGCPGDLNGDGVVNGIDAQILQTLFGPCQPSQCPGDLNGDGVVDDLDLSILQDNFGCSGPGCAGDLNGDGVVDFADLQILKSLFGPCPNPEPVVLDLAYDGQTTPIGIVDPVDGLRGLAISLAVGAPAPIMIMIQDLDGDPQYDEPGVLLLPGGSVAITRPGPAQFFASTPAIPGGFATLELQSYSFGISKPVDTTCTIFKQLRIEHTVPAGGAAATVDASFSVPLEDDACGLEVTITVQQWDAAAMPPQWVTSAPQEQPSSPVSVAPGESKDIGVTLLPNRRVQYETRCPTLGARCRFTYTKTITPN